MVNWQQNIWEARGPSDGRSRAHVPPQPVWSAFALRIIQLLIAFIILVMTAYAADRIGSDLAGFGLTWFTFILTLGYIIYLGVSLFSVTNIYNYWVQLAFESLLVIFWLCSWAVLASEAAALDPLGGWYGFYYRGSSWRSAVNCIKASAALGALLWVTFLVTLVFFVLALLNHRRTAATGTGAVSDKPVIDGPVEMQNQQPAYPQQTYQPPTATTAAHQDSPYETSATDAQQAYPVQHHHQPYEQQAAYPAQPQQQFEQPAPYPVDNNEQQAYATPDGRAPHQQV